MNSLQVLSCNESLAPIQNDGKESSLISATADNSRAVTHLSSDYGWLDDLMGRRELEEPCQKAEAWRHP